MPQVYKIRDFKWTCKVSLWREGYILLSHTWLYSLKGWWDSVWSISSWIQYLLKVVGEPQDLVTPLVLFLHGRYTWRLSPRSDTLWCERSTDKRYLSPISFFLQVRSVYFCSMITFNLIFTSFPFYLVYFTSHGYLIPLTEKKTTSSFYLNIDTLIGDYFVIQP